MLRYARRHGFVATAVVAALICIGSNRAAAFDGVVQGTVKNSSGAPVTGAFVKLTNAEKHLIFMFISQAQGRYTADDLPLGKYTVQGIGSGFQSELVPVDVVAGRAATADVSLTATQAPMPKPALPSARGEGDAELLPMTVAAMPEGDAKKIVSAKCTQCHSIETVLSRRRNHDQWEKTVKTMRQFAESTTSMINLTDAEASTVVDYLATNLHAVQRPKVDANSRLPRTLQQGDAMKYKVVLYEVPPPSRGFHEMTLDPKGNAWVSELAGAHLGKLDAKTLVFSEVATPGTGAQPGKEVILNGMGKGQGDQLWVMDPLNRRLIRYDSKNGEFNVFTVPKLKWGSPMSNSMRIHPDGSLWFTAIQANAVVKFNPASEKFNVYDVPSGVKTGKRAAPYGMTVANGQIWFAIEEFDKIGRVDPATGKVDEFPIPLKNNGWLRPKKVDHDGNGDVWVGLQGAGKIVKVDHKTAQMTIYTPPTDHAGVYGIAGDIKTNIIWAAEDSVDKIARFDPKTETWLEFPVPCAEMDMRRLEVDPNNSNRVWFNGVTSNHIGYVEILDGNGKHM